MTSLQELDKLIISSKLDNFELQLRLYKLDEWLTENNELKRDVFNTTCFLG
jgi:hypothetical protein